MDKPYNVAGDVADFGGYRDLRPQMPLCIERFGARAQDQQNRVHRVHPYTMLQEGRDPHLKTITSPVSG